MRSALSLRRLAVGLSLCATAAFLSPAHAAGETSDDSGAVSVEQLLEQGRLSMFGAQPQDALALFARAAEAGSARALGAIAELHERGIGVPQSHREASRGYRLAISAGDDESRARLGLMLLEGKAEALRMGPWNEGLSLVREAAERGNPFGQFALGRLLLEGLRLPRDEARGLSLIELAARENVAEALACLGHLYAEGREVPAHAPTAVEFLAAAARDGDVSAQARLGTFYRDGWGVERDPLEAVYWLEKAAAAGDADAAANLGVMLMGGGELRQDVPAGLDWLKAAAARGSPLAQFHLGMALLQGRGVAADEKGALVLLREAANRGYADALRQLAKEGR